MTIASVLFPLGVRLSTWATIAVFLAVAGTRRETKPLLACWAWLWGFEAAYDLASIAFRPWSQGFLPEASLYAILGLTTIVWMTNHGVRPSLPLLGAALGLMVLWIALGFHQNFHSAKVIAPGTEALNEATKTMWALAYLWPFLRRPRPASESAGRVAAEAA
jgi:hypothetical protein